MGARPLWDEVNTMRHKTRLAIGTVLMTALLLAPAAMGTPGLGLDDRDDPPCPVSGTRDGDDNGTDVPCPDPVPEGASCRSFGILIVERGSVGSTVVDLSESHAWTEPVPGPVPHYPAADPRPTMPPAPKNPQAHADAQHAGVSYTNPTLLGGVSVEASEVFSRCDVAALDTNEGLHTEAYGRAGVADLEIDLSGIGVSLGAEALDFEDHAYGVPDSTYAFEACDVVEVSVTPGPTFAGCPGKNTGIGVGPATVEIHDSWGPTSNSAGQTLYGGAALHVSASAGSQTVDIYVGYVSVAVTGGEPLDSFWVSDL